MAATKGGKSVHRLEVTSKAVASKALVMLRSPTTTKNAKSVAGSALTQTRDKPKR